MSQRIPDREARILYSKSGNVCAFPLCRQTLTEPTNDGDGMVLISDACHIVARSRQGPRGRIQLTDEDRQTYPNLIALCNNHHRRVDAVPRTYTVSVLRQMKADHERRVARAVTGNDPPQELKLVRETLHSTALSLTHVPRFVYSAPCKYADDEEAVKSEIEWPDDRWRLVPFICREGRLFTFTDLKSPRNPFVNVTNFRQATRSPVTEFWTQPEGHRRFVRLLNSSLYKYTARLDIKYDPVHRRFYFAVLEPGKDRMLRYRPLNMAASERRVAWCPTKKSTGERRNYWLHLGAGLRFVRAADQQWLLTIRPEYHLTHDGTVPLDPDRVGKRVTSLKSRMYNREYLEEVNFWRDVLCRGTPRIVFNYGGQSLICDAHLHTAEIDWPGIPDDETPFRNQRYDEDLFTLAEYEHALYGDDDKDEEVSDKNDEGERL